MNSDDPFDREVRATLDGMAGEPVPDRLVARVAAIPSEVPAAASGRPPVRAVVSGLAALAAVVALAVAAIVLRPAVVPQIGDASATPTQTVPSNAPTPVASALIATVPPTTAPTTSPAPTPTPTAPPLTGDQVPEGFRPMSVTFVSAEQGWVLGSAPCATGRCPAIARTIDGGTTWTTINAPKTTIGSGPAVDVSGKGITGIRFADLRDGWAFGPELWATHDGGKTWKRLDPFSGGAVVALASSHGTVHAVAYDGAQNYRIASAPVVGDAWAVASLKLPVGGGPVPLVQLVLSGEGGWVLENDRTVVAGARLVGGTWHSWQPPCADVVGPAFLGASSATDLAVACDVGAWSSSQGDHFFVSRDGGATFIEIGKRNATIDSASGIATPNRSTIVIAGTDSNGSVLTGSFDSGHAWTVVSRPTSVLLTDLGFTSPTQGVVIATASSGASHLLMTRDGGHTWAIVHF